MPQTKTIELEKTEALMLAVALREYLNGDRGGLRNDPLLRDHPTSKAVIEGVLKMVDLDGAPNG